MYKDITNDTQSVYKITKPGEYVFYFENKTGTLTFDVNCENVSITVYGLYSGKDDDVFSLRITQSHTTPNSASSILIKSVLTDTSKLNITSTISIAKDGIDTNASFTNKNLLLSKQAQTVISPQLEVIPGDVKCTHATTTSPLDTDQLHYLTTRGINLIDAKQLLISGFADEILKNKKD